MCVNRIAVVVCHGDVERRSNDYLHDGGPNIEKIRPSLLYPLFWGLPAISPLLSSLQGAEFGGHNKYSWLPNNEDSGA